jgi:uncharacterized membrane protein (UPF0127 family)
LTTRIGNVSLENRTRETLLAEDAIVADTFLSRLVGLLGQRPAWAQARRGLWIIPSRGVHTLGMRFPIDVIFLDRKNSVVHIEENLRPWRVSRVIGNARSVIELPAHTIGESHTEIGDQIAVSQSRRLSQSECRNRGAARDLSQDPVDRLVDEMEIRSLPRGSGPIDSNHPRIPGKLLDVSCHVDFDELTLV